MKPAETARVLAAAASFDRRTVGTADVAAWHAALHEVDFAEAQQAVIRHYRGTRDWIMPVDILRQIGLMHTELAAEVTEAERTDGHPFAPDSTGTVCTACALPFANRRHQLVGAGRDPEEKP